MITECLLMGCMIAMSPIGDDDNMQDNDTTIVLQQVLVEAKVKPICMRGDTLVYSVPAFTTYEGERLRALLKNVPGIEILADGTIKARGRNVDRILLNGNELIGVGIGSIIDNLPVGYLQNIYLYDDQSRHEKETGIYEGAQEQVIDLITTEEHRTAWLTDITAGGGTHKRYTGNISSGRYSDIWQHSLTATLDNLPSSFGIGESYYDKLQRTVGTADAQNSSLNASVSWHKDKWRLQGSAFYNGVRKDDNTEEQVEAFLQQHRSATYSNNIYSDKTHTINTQLSLTWQDSTWTVHIDPAVSWYKTILHSYNTSISKIDGRTINSSSRHNDGTNDCISAAIRFSVNRKIGNNGRNIDVKGNINLQRESQDAHYINDISFEQNILSQNTEQKRVGSDNITSGNFTIAYVEPLSSTLRLKGEYTFGVSTTDGQQPVQTRKNDVWEHSDRLSRNAKSKNLQHRTCATLQYSKKHLRTLLGIVMEANRTHTVCNRYAFNIDSMRTTIDWSPTASLYYNNSRGLTFTASYGGRSRQPSFFELMHGDDISDPLNIRRGNPGLEAAFIHQFRASLTHFAPSTGRQLNFSVGFDWEQRSITDLVLFDAQHGVRYYQPINVSGNYNLMAAWGLQRNIFSSDKVWLDIQGDVNLSRVVGYQMIDFGHAGDIKDEYYYSTLQSCFMQYVAVQGRVGYCTIKPYGYLRYDHIGSSLSGAISQNIFVYGYGCLGRFEHPCGVSLSVDCYEHSRSGYFDTTLNRNSFIIDFEIAYSFLKKHAAEVRLMACDLLHKRDFASDNLSQLGWTELRGHSAINSYLMATVTYRF